MKSKYLVAGLIAMFGVNSAYPESNPIYPESTPIPPESNPITPESDTMDNIRLFDSFFQDAAIPDSPYIEGVFEYDDFNAGALIPFGVRGGLPIFEQFDIGASFGGIHVDPDRVDSETGVSDFTLVARYHILEFKPVSVTAGMRFDIPTGDSDVGADTLEYEAFGAVRYPVLDKLVITGHAGLGYVEPTDDDGDFSLFLSTGAIYEVNNKLHVIAEFSGDTEREVGFFDAGVDYEVIPNGRIRVAFGAGFGDDNRAPNFTFQSGFLYNFGNLNLFAR
ncbi:MAG: hypothetical protein V3V18_11660 [Methylococcales bacterium]